MFFPFIIIHNVSLFFKKEGAGVKLHRHQTTNQSIPARIGYLVGIN